MRWDDVQEIDQRLAALNTKVCILTIDPRLMKQRIVGDKKKNGWNAFLHRFRESDEEIIDYFIRQQEELLCLSELTRLPCHMVDTSNISIETVVEEILDFWELV